MTQIHSVKDTAITREWLEDYTVKGFEGGNFTFTSGYSQVVERNVEVLDTNELQLPQHETKGSAGADIRALIEYPIILEPGQRKLISTGLFIGIPVGYEVQIRSRSGLAYKHGVFVLNSPATIDSDYIGEVKVLLANIGDKSFTINNGDRIAQLILAEHARFKWVTVNKLKDTERGTGGFSSTGVK